MLLAEDAPGLLVFLVFLVDNAYLNGSADQLCPVKLEYLHSPKIKKCVAVWTTRDGDPPLHYNENKNEIIQLADAATTNGRITYKKNDRMSIRINLGRTHQNT
jgi:hypothetical protein